MNGNKPRSVAVTATGLFLVASLLAKIFLEPLWNHPPKCACVTTRNTDGPNSSVYMSDGSKLIGMPIQLITNVFNSSLNPRICITRNAPSKYRAKKLNAAKRKTKRHRGEMWVVWVFSVVPLIPLSTAPRPPPGTTLNTHTSGTSDAPTTTVKSARCNRLGVSLRTTTAPQKSTT